MGIQTRVWIGIFTFVLATAPGWAGNGLGAGNGFPRIEFEQEDLGRVPEFESLQKLIRSIAKEHPSLAYRMELLLPRFGATGEHRMIHQKGEYPFQFANSEGWPIRDEWGIPVRAQVTVWNEFFELPSDKRLEVILHELIHILVTDRHEKETEELTQFFLGRTPQMGPQAQALLAASLEEMTRAANSKQNEAVLAYFRQWGGIPGECSEVLSEQDLAIGGRNYRFPKIDASVLSRLKRDPVLSRHFLTGCLNRSAEGRTLTQGFFDHPHFRLGFAREVLGEPLRLRLAARPVPASDLEWMDSAPFYDPLVQRLKSFETGATQAQLREKIPGFSDWEKLRKEILGEGIVASPVVFSASHLLFLSRDALMNSGDPEWVTLESRGVKEISCRANEVSATQLELTCESFAPGWVSFWDRRVSSRWTVDLLWMIRALKSGGSFDYNIWKGIRFTDPSNEKPGAGR